MRKAHNLRRHPPPPPKFDYEKKEHEILKAVVQAWLSRHNSTISSANNSSEFDTRKRNFQPKPSRFKLEATRKLAEEEHDDGGSSGSSWDFNQSLWDTYEIVAVSKRLEEGLLLGDTGLLASTLSGGLEDGRKKLVVGRTREMRKESKNSLRNLIDFLSSRRFNESIIPL